MNVQVLTPTLTLPPEWGRGYAPSPSQGEGWDGGEILKEVKSRISIVTTTRARSLRATMTDAERLLWQKIRAKQINGNRFRRQHPIGQYIADFACIEQRIVIELDGGQHHEKLAYDERRTEFLRQHGWQVLRFWNNDVLNNLDGVLTVVAERLASTPPP